jgi:hypothetical protein
MKIWKNATVTMKVPGCMQCPNRVAKRYSKGQDRFGSYWICKAITKTYCIKGEESTYNPPVNDRALVNGFLEDCPLPEAEA